jgi:hypothetical protein
MKRKEMSRKAAVKQLQMQKKKKMSSLYSKLFQRAWFLIQGWDIKSSSEQTPSMSERSKKTGNALLQSVGTENQRLLSTQMLLESSALLI